MTPHWQYFLSVEQSFEATTRYVEVAEANYPTYSIEFVRLLLSIGSEIDVVCKVLCQRLDPSRRPNSINAYQKIIIQHYPRFASVTVEIPQYGLSYQPWASWAEAKSLQWWKKYNEVKHNRNEAYPDANLINTLSALGGLYCVVLYLYQEELYGGQLWPGPRLFRAKAAIGISQITPWVGLPDF